MLYNQSWEPDMECAIPAEPAATARNTHGICSEKKPVVSPTMGIAAASTKFTMADFRQPQYHKPAPGRTKLRSDAFVERFIATPELFLLQNGSGTNSAEHPFGHLAIGS